MPTLAYVTWMAIWLSWVTLAFGADLPTLGIMPNATTTPGAAANLTAKQLCAKSFRTGSERPDESVTEALKRNQLKAWGYADQSVKDYEEDHLISLEIGGDPQSAKNLWPELYAGKCGAHVKDKLENRLKQLVCDGRLPLAQAQQEIATNWVAAYKAHVGKLSCP